LASGKPVLYHQKEVRISLVHWTKVAMVVASTLFLFFPAVQADGKVLVAVGDWTPFISEESPTNGPLSEIITRSFAEVGINTAVQFLPWKRAYEKTKETMYDVSPGWRVTEERQRDFYFSDVILVQAHRVYFSKSNPINVSSNSDLTGLRAGGLRGSLLLAGDQDVLDKEKIETVFGDNYQNLFKMMMRGRLDFIYMSQFVAEKAIRDALPQKQWEQVGYIENLSRDERYFLIVSKQHRNGTVLIEKFNRGLQLLRNSGEYDRILNSGLKAMLR